MTLHDLIKDLTEYLSLTPEQQFRVTAKIKRYVHSEKFGVYMRYAMYAGSYDKEKGIQPKDPWLCQILEQSRDNHLEWGKKSDEEIVTWNVGTHEYVKYTNVEVECCGCSKKLTVRLPVDYKGKVFCTEECSDKADEADGS